MSLSAARLSARCPRSVQIVLPALISLIALQGLGFAVLGTGRAGLLVSQSAQLVVNLVALVCIFCAYKRAQAVARTFWLLVGCAFFCWLIANAAWIYGTYRGVLLVPESIFNFLYRLYGAPLLMALFLKEDDESTGSRFLRLFDFLQIGMVALLFYLAEFYLPMKGMLPREALLLNLLSISNTENVLLLLLTAGRYRLARSVNLRPLFGRLLALLAIYGAVAAVGNYLSLYASTAVSAWFDLFWTAPYIAAAVLALAWSPSDEKKTKPKKSGGSAGALAFHLTLAGLVLCVVVLAQHFTGAWHFFGIVTVVVSLGLYAARLSLAQDREARAATALSISEQNYRSLFERNLAGVFRASLSGRFLEVNNAFVYMFGYDDRKEILEEPFAMTAIPELRAELVRMVQFSSSISGLETCLRRKDGSAIWVLISVSIVKDAAGSCLEGTVIDITQLKLVEEELRKSKNHYELLFQKNPQAMWVYEPGSLKFLDVNEAAIRSYGYTRQEFLSMKLTDIRPQEDVPALLQNLTETRGKNSEESGGFRQKKKDGTIIYVHISESRVDFDGHPAELVMAQDVTERRNLEEQLRQSQKMEAVGRLAGGVAHDFNNLLNIIGGYLELTQEYRTAADTVEKYSQKALDATRRAATLVRQLLAFSRKQVLAPRVLDLNNEVGELGRMLPRIIGEDVELSVVAACKEAQVRVDQAQIEQVVVNLAVNARDAMPKGGKLTIETRSVTLDEDYHQTHRVVPPGKYVMLSVSDTGIGMPEEIRAHIFEPFFTTKEKGKGTGLGLSMVYGIVKQSDGFIWVYSEVGHGTTFKIYLPAVAGEHQAQAVPARSAETQGSETILLAEDETALREVASAYLTRLGYRVFEAGDGCEAIKIVEKMRMPIALLITDVVMPKMNGRELAGRLQAEFPNMKVLFVSGYTDDAVVRHGVIGSTANFLQKPFDLRALAEKVREVIAKNPKISGQSETKTVARV